MKKFICCLLMLICATSLGMDKYRDPKTFSLTEVKKVLGCIEIFKQRNIALYRESFCKYNNFICSKPTVEEQKKEEVELYNSCLCIGLTYSFIKNDQVPSSYDDFCMIGDYISKNTNLLEIKDEGATSIFDAFDLKTLDFFAYTVQYPCNQFFKFTWLLQKIEWDWLAQERTFLEQREQELGLTPNFDKLEFDKK